MAEEQKGAAQEPGESQEGNETSETQEPTTPQPGQIDIAKRYQVNKLGDEVTGDELISGYNRGRMFDKTQSELHKTQTEFKKMAEQYQATLDELQRMKQQQLVKEELTKVVPSQRSEDNWFTEDNEKEQIDPNEIVRQVTENVRRPVDTVLERLGLANTDDIPDLDTLVEQRIQQREAEARRARERERWIQQTRDQDKKQLLSNFGSVLDESRINEILDSLDVGVTLQRRAEATIGDPETEQQAIEDYAKSRDLLLSVADNLADAKIKKQQQEREEELKQQLSTNKFPGISPPPKDEERKPIFNEKDREARKKKMLEMAVKSADAREMAKRQIGGA